MLALTFYLIRIYRQARFDGIMNKAKSKRFFRYTIGILLLILVIGYCLPQPFVMPVKGAGQNSYAQNSFWFYPWGKSVTHKGVDVFAKAGTDVIAATPGLVIRTGTLKRGGNMVLVLGPKWRFHYYAHLKEIKTSSFHFVKKGSVIGSVGNTGNAAGKPAHLHYAISSMLPLPWRMDKTKQGWKKMFFLNPVKYLNTFQ